EIKRKVLAELDALAPDQALIATNTSAIPITELAAATRRADRVLGLHFFSPVPLMQAVEVVRGIATSDETFAAGQAFVHRLGKEPIPVHRDVPGFLLNRLNLPSSVEAMRLVEQGVGTPEDIDRGVRLAFGRKMGIFETGDMVGLDVTHGALMALYEETRDPRWYPPEILRRKVKAGHLGKKTGRGWYRYDDQGMRVD
ncbi:MAG: 3-hydroxyacyl-CoA dehydrogenase family protein, partial [Deltaproteobacteria bacterium]|nr:3-hydroxyacyl-CoA dehydrogenase family protein [Deltaproteobacteria bacterium]